MSFLNAVKDLCNESYKAVCDLPTVKKFNNASPEKQNNIILKASLAAFAVLGIALCLGAPPVGTVVLTVASGIAAFAYFTDRDCGLGGAARDVADRIRNWL